MSFVYLFKEPALSSTDIFWSFFFKVSVLFISNLLFISSLLLAWVLCVLLFLVSLGLRLGCLFEIFLVSRGRPVFL